MTGSCKAVCQIASSSNNNVLGYLTLTQIGSDDGPTVKLTGSLSGLTPGKHGISVCAAGDLSEGATSCGPIFNPFDKRHGAPEDTERMAGDLGNIVVDETGSATVDLTYTSSSRNGSGGVQLLGPHSVIGRSMVIYAGEDDRGRGGHENSQQTGNPGPRIAAGVIGLCL